MSPTLAVARALADLVDTARERGMEAKRLGYQRIAFGLLSIAADLDGARTCLVQEGEAYIDAAWAFVDAGRTMIADWTERLARAEAGHVRA